jgi:predicted phosphodiesterase
MTGKNVLAISDMHPGSKVSAIPPGFKDENNQEIVRSPLNIFLWNKWCEMCNWANKKKVDIVILCGDCGSDGKNYKSSGLGQITTDLTRQTDLALEMLSKINCDTYVGVNGSFYHVGDNNNTDKILLQRLGDKGKNVYTKEGNLHFDDDLAITIENVRLHVRHWTNQTKSLFMYRGTPLARQLMQLAQSEKEMGRFDLILRGHVHYYFGVFTGSKLAMTLPAWQGRYSYVKRSLLGSSTLGAVIFNLQKVSKTKGKWDWEPFIFKLEPKYNITEISF